uniref:Uncharacterized protein n=1 Tax=Rhizophora mucronata TaxID=61149 RepID=A0A2P2QFL2_RHIMU
MVLCLSVRSLAA